MTQLNIFLLFAALSSLSPTAKNIEKAFLQNNPHLLYSLLSSQSQINITLPEPVSFSDQLSPQQAYFLFERIFSTFTTFEFYSGSELPLFPEKQHFIFKARWSFKNNKNNNQYVFQLFFYLMNEGQQKGKAGPLRSKEKLEKFEHLWKITEIKAEKL